MESERHRWRLVRLRAQAELIHRWWPRDAASRWILTAEPARPAAVLGSTTRGEAFDEDRLRARGLEVARRGSGGGAVVVAPGEQAWLHVFLPSQDPLLQSHLGRSFLWLGEAVAEALATLGVEGLTIVEEPPPAPELARRVCFAGWGWGEVGVAGRKVAGLSQRRRRDGAMFHLDVLLEDRQHVLIDALRERPSGELISAGVRAHGVTLEALLAALIEAIGRR